MGHRKMPAYGEREHGGRYILDEYEWSRNHCKAVTIRRWKRDLKRKPERITAGWCIRQYRAKPIRRKMGASKE